jgi:hypothetical protein
MYIPIYLLIIAPLLLIFIFIFVVINTYNKAIASASANREMEMLRRFEEADKHLREISEAEERLADYIATEGKVREGGEIDLGYDPEVPSAPTTKDWDEEDEERYQMNLIWLQDRIDQAKAARKAVVSGGYAFDVYRDWKIPAVYQEYLDRRGRSASPAALEAVERKRRALKNSKYGET